MQIFYKALVVNNDSKKGDRRIQVRVLGIHPFESEIDYPNVPDEVLPWARIAPSISGSFSGEVFNVPKNGEWVWVFFEDEGFQQPIYFAYVSADTDVDSEFKPNENEITTNRYNGQKTVVTEKYQSNTTNGNGLLLSTNENKAMLTNNTIATILVGHDMKSYVGKDETPQSMVYGNRLLNCFQSTLNALEQSFNKLRKKMNSIYVSDSMGVADGILGSLNKAAETMDEMSENVSIKIPSQEELLKIANTKKDENNNEYVLQPTDEGYISASDLPKIEIPDISGIVDFADIKKTILEPMSSMPSNTVAMGSVWTGEVAYTAKINLALTNIYMALDTLYNMILYCVDREHVNEVTDKWRDSKALASDDSEGLDEYEGISRVRDNLKYTLNNNALFYPEQQDLNQLIIDEYENGTLPTSENGKMPINSNFNSIRCKKMKPENVRYIIVHCSDSDFGDAELINKWHQERGWCKIGYQYVITNGCKTKKEYVDNGNQPLPISEIQKGRMDDEQGAHTQGYNHKSIGICLIGTNKFSAIQLASAAGLIDTLRKKYNIPKENVLRHCDTEQAHGKTCPNLDNIQWKAFIAMLNN